MCSLPGVLFAIEAQAQTIPASVDPGRISNELRPDPIKISRLVTQVARLNQELSNELLAQEVFELGNLTVAGNTVIAEEVIAEFTDPLRAKQTVTALDMAGLVGKLREIYAEVGYALIVVHRPLYGLVDGQVHVRIEIVEGHVDEVTWSSDRVGTARQGHWAKKLTTEKPLTSNTRYRYESLAKELPGMEVNGTLISGKEVGATRIEFNDELTKKAEYSQNRFKKNH